jgi:hypothetical protein
MIASCNLHARQQTIAKMLAAIAPPAKLISAILTAFRMANENRYDRRFHDWNLASEVRAQLSTELAQDQ